MRTGYKHRSCVFFSLSRNVVELFDLIEILVNQDRTESGCISNLVYVYKCKNKTTLFFLFIVFIVRKL